MSTRTIAVAFDSFNSDIRPVIDDDAAALSAAWNDYTNSLYEDGRLSDLLYRLCPAVSDVRPSDDDMNVVANAIGLTMVAKGLAGRPGGARWPADARHFLVTLKIADRTMAVPYSMGSAVKGDPTIDDVLDSVLLDIYGVKGLAVGIKSDFSQWCAEVGYDVNRREAHRVYCACIAAREEFVALMGDAISESDFDDLQVIVA